MNQTPDLFMPNFKVVFALKHLDSLLSRNIRFSAEEREFLTRIASMRDHIEDISVDDYNTLKEIHDEHYPRGKRGNGMVGMAALERRFRRKSRAAQDND